MQATPEETTNPEKKHPVRRLYGHMLDINARREYCFVRSDNGKSYFLHANDLDGGVQEMKRGAGVFFTPLKIKTAGKHDKAIDAVPAKPGQQ